MKKSLLYTVLITSLCVVAYAEIAHSENATINPLPDTALPTPAAATTINAPTSQEVPIPAPVIDCNYHIPAGSVPIDQSLIKQWSEKAAQLAFSFDFNSIDNQLIQLKNCFTDQGWQSFNDALQKSGNLAAIKSQQLTVSSMITGDINVNQIKDNQWKVTLPLQVVYQNDKEKIIQPLSINLVVGRKLTGDLGVMQMIATPQQTNTQTIDTNTAPTQTTPSTSSPTTTQPTPTTESTQP